jgi:hypothetical protein
LIAHRRGQRCLYHAVRAVFPFARAPTTAARLGGGRRTLERPPTVRIDDLREAAVAFAALRENSGAPTS